MNEYEDMLYSNKILFLCKAPLRNVNSKLRKHKTVPVRNQVSSRDRVSKSSRGPAFFRNKMNDDGSYSFKYQTGDGMSREEKGWPASCVNLR